MLLFEDGISGSSPLEWPAVGVVRSHEVIDALDELFDAGEGAAPNDLRHLPTVALVNPKRSAMTLLSSPSALLKTRRARVLKEPGSERLRAKGWICERSSADNTTSVFGLPDLIPASPFHRYRFGCTTNASD